VEGSKSNKSETSEILSSIRKLLRHIDFYLSKGGRTAVPEEITEILKELGRLESASKLLIENADIGIRVFKKLKKYISARLCRLDIRLSKFLIHYAVPLIILKAAFDAFYEGKERVSSLAKVPGMTKNYIKGAFRRLRRIAEMTEETRILKSSVQREIFKIRELLSLIELEEEKLRAQHKRLQALFNKNWESLEAVGMLNSTSRRELILRLLAYIDYESKEGRYANEL